MASVPTLTASGTQTAVIGTEHTLLSTTAGGVYVFQVDANALATNDVLRLYIKTKTLSGGTLRGTYYTVFEGAFSVSDCTFVSVPIASDVQADFVLQQTAGTGRAFPWKVLAL